MMATDILFYLLATSSLMLAILSVTSANLLRSVVYLMGVLFLSSGFYLLLNAQFLAGVQVLVYVGGIVVLLVFAVMLTKAQELLEETPSMARQAVAAVVSSAFFGMVLKVMRESSFSDAQPGGAVGSDVAAIGKAFLDPGAQGYVLPFEVISILLLAVLVGGMVMARKTISAGSES